MATKTDWERRAAELLPCSQPYVCETGRHISLCPAHYRETVIIVLREFAEEAAGVAARHTEHEEHHDDHPDSPTSCPDTIAQEIRSLLPAKKEG